MRRSVIPATKTLIVVLFAIILACQVWIVPVIGASFARSDPDFAALQIPGVVMVDALLLCGQIVLVCVWRLLSLTARDTIFDAAAFRWVDAIVVAVILAIVLIAAGLIVLSASGAGSPIIALTGLIGLIAMTGLALVVVVMRGLLRQATALRQEMAEVV
jgi:hypothetical protein